MRPFKLLLIWTVVTLACGTAECPAETQAFEMSYNNMLMRCTKGPSEAESVGSYAIRLYRESGRDDGDRPFYDDYITGLVHERDGELAGCWISDLDEDKSIEVAVFTRTVGSGRYGTLDLFRFREDSLSAVPLPEPSGAFLEGYRGRDRFAVENGRVRRTFPVYLKADANCCPTGGSRTLELDMNGMKWHVLNTDGVDSHHKSHDISPTPSIEHSM